MALIQHLDGVSERKQITLQRASHSADLVELNLSMSTRSINVSRILEPRLSAVLLSLQATDNFTLQLDSSAIQNAFWARLAT